MYALVLGSSMFLDFETLKPLFGCMKSVPICMSDKTSGLSFDELKAECSIFKRVFSSLDLKTFENNRSEIDICKGTTYMLKNYCDIAPILLLLDLLQLELLFERKTLQPLSFDDFLKEWKKKPKKLCFD